MQENVTINGQVIPVILHEGGEYYPISYFFSKVLNRNMVANSFISNDNYKKYIIHHEINFGFSTGGLQSTYCIEKEGLIKYLQSKKGRGNNLNDEKKKLLRGVCDYFKIQIEGVHEQTLEDEYIKDCIRVVVEQNPNIKFKKCDTCGISFQVHKNFFNIDARLEGGLTSKCRLCKKWDENRSQNNYIHHENKDVFNLYRKFGVDGLNVYKGNIAIEDFHFKHVYKKEGSLHKLLRSKDNYTKIIKYYYDIGVITTDNLTLDLFLYELGLKNFSSYLTLDEVYEYLFGIDYKYYPWKYKNYKIKNATYEDGKIILNNYLKEFDVKLNNKLEDLNSDILAKAKLYEYSRDALDFLVYYCDYKYAGYKFKCKSVKYYKNKKNRIFDLKYLIEKDLKIPLDKIPLYLTKMTLQRNARSLYMVLYSGKYYNNLFEWVNECYPNKFIEADFVVNPYRDEFDSQEELEINNLLKEHFKNVIYNQRNTYRTVNIDGMIPDWLVFTDSRCYLVEYFGLYIERQIQNTRVREYIDKTKNKIDKYKKLNGYGFIDLYPEDLDNNMYGVKEKLKYII